MLRAAPQHTPVRVAVGCGDKTIRVLTLGVRQQLVQTSSSSSSDGTSPASCNDEFGSIAASASGAVHDAAADAMQGNCSSSSSSSSSSAGEAADRGQQQLAAACSEVQPGVQHSQLLWRNIQDKVLAVAWHPTNPRGYCTMSAGT
jgi:hypothetical protein